MCFLSPFSNFNSEGTSITLSKIRNNGNVQSHDQEESKLNSTIITNIGTHTLIDNHIINSLFNKNNVETIIKK